MGDRYTNVLTWPLNLKTNLAWQLPPPREHMHRVLAIWAIAGKKQRVLLLYRYY